MKVYRMLTGPDDAVFCRRVTEALQQGWDLYGNPVMTYTPDGVQVGQAVVKELEGAYDPDKPLRDY
ncbi:Uncharacterized conserved small protein [Neisseria animaloris]|uniref:Uncharacterized conserved small protein n=1 Tax=Neisseria animaloris TaxID=326522 RepID=A0A1X3CM75_9NEIS|nr:DUF1737 domain-containing protein [Neisseria animaloris]OSI08706.1 hypothetical protein BWD08_00865 [Neisseria animaloris]VEH87339.1 Uncharacterized conserved small protein [Neisseria animaloris]VEJ20517.1 Uncharacterized conserved small protein [Neisseria animaloris]